MGITNRYMKASFAEGSACLLYHNAQSVLATEWSTGATPPREVLTRAAAFAALHGTGEITQRKNNDMELPLSVCGAHTHTHTKCKGNERHAVALEHGYMNAVIAFASDNCD